MVHTRICLCLCGRLDLWISPERVGFGPGRDRLDHACAAALVAHSKDNLKRHHAFVEDLIGIGIRFARTQRSASAMG